MMILVLRSVFQHWPYACITLTICFLIILCRLKTIDHVHSCLDWAAGIAGDSRWVAEIPRNKKMHIFYSLSKIRIIRKSRNVSGLAPGLEFYAGSQVVHAFIWNSFHKCFIFGLCSVPSRLIIAQLL